jgi:hypothetical protein
VGTAGGLIRRRSWLRALSGVLAGGLVALALVLAVVALLARHAGTPGPGASTLVWHAAAAIAAVAAQSFADRRGDRAGTVAALTVLALTVAAVGGLWLA